MRSTTTWRLWYGLTSGPGLLVGTQEGLATSGDACSWTLFPSLGSPILDLVVKKDDSKAAIALVAVAGKVDDAGNATWWFASNR